MKKKKSLLFDITSTERYFLCGHCTGVGRSTLELVNALNGFPDLPFNLIFFSQNIKGIGVNNFSSVHKKLHLYLPKRTPFTTLGNAIGLKRLISGYDVLHIPHNTDSPERLHDTIFTIHDLIAYRYPEMWGLTPEIINQHRKLAHGCKAIVTCSEASKRDIAKFWEVDEKKITVIPWGVNREIFKPNLNPLTEIKGLGDDFFLTTACNHPRKQPELIVDAFDLYLRQGGKAQLVMLKPSVNNSDKLNALVANGKIIIVQNISDSLLVKLYSHAKASIIISLYEGFGLPILESLACGTQVIAARNSSLVEVGGNVVDYLDIVNPQSLSSKLLYYDEDKQSPNLNLCDTLLKNFTWSKCAAEYVDFWTAQLDS